MDISRLSRFCLPPLLLLFLPPHHPLNTQQLLGISLAKPEQKNYERLHVGGDSTYEQLATTYYRRRHKNLSRMESMDLWVPRAGSQLAWSVEMKMM